MADVGGFAAGVIVAFTAQSVVQLYVVPLAEQRKRREQRWEQNVIELADLLAGELTTLASTAGSDARVLAAVMADMSTQDRADRIERLEPFIAEAREKQRAYDALSGGRVRLLLDRVVAFAPDAKELAALSQRAMRYKIAALGTSGIQYAPMLEEPLDPKTVNADWEREGRARSALIAEVAALSVRQRPPRTGAARRLRLWVKRSRPVAAVGRVRARHQARRESAGTAAVGS